MLVGKVRHRQYNDDIDSIKFKSYLSKKAFKNNWGLPNTAM